MPRKTAKQTPPANPAPSLAIQRTQEIIQIEYEAAAKAVGDKDYRIDCLSREKGPLMRKMFELNQEMAALKSGAPQS